MPFGDGTGPMGMGPMTGRAAGYCAGYPTPGVANPIPGAGWGRGFYPYGYMYPGAGYYRPPYATPYPTPYGGSIPYAPFRPPWFGRGFGRGRGGRGRWLRGWWW